ncbi:hypothetical protein BDU57DRAFT_540095 [Ampelomyces quisqualis]|uniref:Aminoglycoside phosphotransferase domain-containing protein n=1 Tax=Ampelomyces quisqualis TaxID=50730 RepID=A0A6A5QHY9_AMPQU|nr:hypothetical protein BDU57DRAFT_540095 [Ampelomyces quisqualis]
MADVPPNVEQVQEDSTGFVSRVVDKFKFLCRKPGHAHPNGEPTLKPVSTGSIVLEHTRWRADGDVLPPQLAAPEAATFTPFSIDAIATAAHPTEDNGQPADIQLEVSSKISRSCGAKNSGSACHTGTSATAVETTIKPDKVRRDINVDADILKTPTIPVQTPQDSCSESSDHLTRPAFSARAKLRRALFKLKTMISKGSKRSHSQVGEEMTEDIGYASQGKVDEDRAQWDEIFRISDETFKKLLVRALPQDRKPIAARVVGKRCGSYHLVVFLIAMNSQYEYEDFVIKVPSHGVRGVWSHEDIYMLTQEAETMKYISQNTTIPTPQIFAYSPTVLNHFRFPYIIMSKLPGQSAANIWFDQPHDHDAPNQMNDFPSIETEQKRLNFLRSLAVQMTKLKELPFDAIGMPTLGDYEGKTDTSVAVRLPVDKTYVWPYADQVYEVVERPAFASSQAYVEAAMARQKLFILDKDDDEEHKNAVTGLRKILEIVFSHPVFQSAPEDTFFLQHDDLDLQNILTDEDGNVTGIIDWDGSLAVPRCVGHSAAPNFLRRDWFPSDVDSSPHLHFRANHYREIYAAALFAAGNPDAKYTTKSAIYQAAIASINAGGCKYDIVDKLLQEIGFRGQKYGLAAFYGSPQGYKADEILKTKLYKVLEPVLPSVNLVELEAHLAAQVWLQGFVGLLELETEAN